MISIRAASLCLLAASIAAHANVVDDVVLAQMRDHNIPGLSLAIVDGGKIIRAQGYGFTDKTGHVPVTADTLFQAGSVSKPVAALGALSLVERGKLNLDEDVNVKLRSWKVPENEFTKDQKATLRLILCHSAGFTVHGFAGYAVDAPRPTLLDILDGRKPANSSAIRVDFVPGSKLSYSGGGYTVMQQLVNDVTGQPFPQFMEESVLKPFGMTHSSYEQPPRTERAAATATGYFQTGAAVKGRWHIYPEMAAAGLWTTPSDLARFIIGIQRSYSGLSNPVVSESMTHQLLTDQREGDGLGLFVRGQGKNLRFYHNGRNEGFDTLLVALAETGKGAAIMINANDDTGVLNKVAEAIAREHYWASSAP